MPAWEIIQPYKDLFLLICFIIIGFASRAGLKAIRSSIEDYKKKFLKIEKEILEIQSDSKNTPEKHKQTEDKIMKNVQRIEVLEEKLEKAAIANTAQYKKLLDIMSSLDKSISDNHVDMIKHIDLKIGKVNERVDSIIGGILK